MQVRTVCFKIALAYMTWLLKELTSLLTYVCTFYTPTGEEVKRCEELYNEAQRKWIDDMITACQVSHTSPYSNSILLMDLVFQNNAIVF